MFEVTTSFADDGETRKYNTMEEGLTAEIAMAGPAVIARLIATLHKKEIIDVIDIGDILGVADVKKRYE